MKINLAQIPEEGLQRTLQLDLGAMARLREAIGEQQGSLAAEVRIKNREGSVEVTGHLRATLLPPCQRCLEGVRLEIDDPVRVALVPDRRYDEAADDIRLDAGDLEVSFYEGEELDLSHILEDELLLLIPETVAEEDDAGCCTVCGKRIADVLPDDDEARPGHPFAGMKGLLDND